MLAIVCGLFLAGLSYSGITTLNVMADPPRQQTSSYLVVITYDDVDELQRLRPLKLHLIDAQADRLVKTLADYKIAGRVTKVHPGPVVTMYELEPAPGLKASRVIGLADDIARSMSALSARARI